MPYKSKAQAAYFNIHRKELERQGVDVDEWNDASRGKKLPKKVKKEAKEAFMVGYRETLKMAGLAEPSDQDRLIAILAQLQHHLDDAEVYGGQGLQIPAHLSIDDAEEGVEDLSQELLPPQKAKVIEEVAEKGDEEEEEKGVEEPGHAQEKESAALPDDVSPEAAFELGLRRGLQKLGFAGVRLEAMVEVGLQHGLGNIKTAGDVVEVLTPFAIADTHEKLAAEEAHPMNKVLRQGLAKHAAALGSLARGAGKLMGGVGKGLASSGARRAIRPPSGMQMPALQMSAMKRPMGPAAKIPSAMPNKIPPLPQGPSALQQVGSGAMKALRNPLPIATAAGGLAGATAVAQ